MRVDNHPVITTFKEQYPDSSHNITLEQDGKLAVTSGTVNLLLDTANGARILGYNVDNKPVLYGSPDGNTSTHLSIGKIAGRGTEVIKKMLEQAQAITSPEQRELFLTNLQKVLSGNNPLSSILDSLPAHGGVRNNATELTEISDLGGQLFINLRQDSNNLGQLSQLLHSIDYKFTLSPQGLTYTTLLKASDGLKETVTLPVLHHLYFAIKDLLIHPPKIQFPLDKDGSMPSWTEKNGFGFSALNDERELLIGKGRGLTLPTDTLILPKSPSLIIKDPHGQQQITVTSEMDKEGVFPWNIWSPLGDLGAEKYKKLAPHFLAVEPVLPEALPLTIIPGQTISLTTSIKSQSIV